MKRCVVIGGWNVSVGFGIGVREWELQVCYWEVSDWKWDETIIQTLLMLMHLMSFKLYVLFSRAVVYTPSKRVDKERNLLVYIYLARW